MLGVGQISQEGKKETPFYLWAKFTSAREWLAAIKGREIALPFQQLHKPCMKGEVHGGMGDEGSVRHG